MTSYIRPQRTEQWFRDIDGILATTKRNDEKRAYSLDYSRRLGADTIASVSWESDGVTLSGESNTTTALTFSVTATGTATATITLASGAIWEDKRRFIGTDEGTTDYA